MQTNELRNAVAVAIVSARAGQGGFVSQLVAPSYAGRTAPASTCDQQRRREDRALSSCKRILPDLRAGSIKALATRCPGRGRPVGPRPSSLYDSPVEVGRANPSASAASRRLLDALVTHVSLR